MANSQEPVASTGLESCSLATRAGKKEITMPNIQEPVRRVGCRAETGIQVGPAPDGRSEGSEGGVHTEPGTVFT